MSKIDEYKEKKAKYERLIELRTREIGLPSPHQRRRSTTGADVVLTINSFSWPADVVKLAENQILGHLLTVLDWVIEAAFIELKIAKDSAAEEARDVLRDLTHP